MIEKMISTSRTTEVHGNARLIITAYQQSPPVGDTFLPPVITLLESKNKELGLAIDRTKAQSILADKDNVRDYGVRAVGYLVQGYAYYPDQTVRDAANTVEQVFDKYGFAITEEAYVVESSHIISMLDDFKAPKIQSALALLPGVTENIAALQAAEDDFEATQAEYAEELAEENTKSNATTLKKEVVNIINNDLVVFLRWGERFQPDTYDAFARTVGKIIADNNEAVKKRRKKENSEEGI